MIIFQNDTSETIIEETFENTGAKVGMIRFFINTGNKKGVSPRDVVDCIINNTAIALKVELAQSIFLMTSAL